MVVKRGTDFKRVFFQVSAAHSSFLQTGTSISHVITYYTDHLFRKEDVETARRPKYQPGPHTYDSVTFGA